MHNTKLRTFLAIILSLVCLFLEFSISAAFYPILTANKNHLYTTGNSLMDMIEKYSGSRTILEKHLFNTIIIDKLENNMYVTFFNSKNPVPQAGDLMLGEYLCYAVFLQKAQDSYIVVDVIPYNTKANLIDVKVVRQFNNLPIETVLSKKPLARDEYEQDFVKNLVRVVKDFSQFVKEESL
ncbi:MAG: hypothetical protein QXT40_02640 [Candidatus Micrarchaeia archaeon]